MKLQVVSDLHLEHRPLVFNDIIDPCADVIALLGDIGIPTDVSYQEFIKWCSINYQFVLVITGNHEYYNRSGISIDNIDKIIESICDAFDNVVFLNNKTFKIGDVVFIGSTLWSWIPSEHVVHVWSKMNDYRLIWNSNGNLLTPYESRMMYIENIKWISNSVYAAYTGGSKVVVLTHHCPTLNGTSASFYEGLPGTHAFATDLPHDFPVSAVRLWCSGHTHHNFHHNESGFELLSNQYGYSQKPTRGYTRGGAISI